MKKVFLILVLMWSVGFSDVPDSKYKEALRVGSEYKVENIELKTKNEMIEKQRNDCEFQKLLWQLGYVVIAALKFL